MGTIKIIKKGRSAYKVGTTIEMSEVLNNFTSNIKDVVLKDYLASIPMAYAVAEIAFAQGFEYELC